jgi:glucose-6-phosphate isomerase
MVFDQLPEYQALEAHYHAMVDVHMRTLFANDPQRFEHFSLHAAGLLLDYAKNRITKATIDLLCDLAGACELPHQIKALFAGNFRNSTEHRSVAHVALRYSQEKPFYVAKRDVMPDVRDVLTQMTEIAEHIRMKTWLGATGYYITDVVNIGIGGSDLGPALVTEALRPYHDAGIHCHFVSNIDGVHIESVLSKLHPARTLFIVASKSFTTQETLLNAATAKAWLQKTLGKHALTRHMLAITSHMDRAMDFGIEPEHVLPLWDWVGGRFSIWSAIGLPVMIAIGPARFREFLQGAEAMDEHFATAPLHQNMPAILALLSIWYINFFGTRSYAVLPYQQLLAGLPAYLQQAEMESNGKYRRHDGEAVQYQTGTVIWGTTGSNGQHAVHQLLHQGTQLIPVDFIVPMVSHDQLGDHHKHLVANCLSQSQALMCGHNEVDIFEKLSSEGVDVEAAKLLAKHQSIPGNRPSNTLTFDQLSPRRLGALLALYEHKIFVQGIIWGINSFDQWGVELGKSLTKDILQAIGGKAHEFDASTKGLVAFYQEHQQKGVNK